MLLIIRRRNPLLASILGIVAALVFLAIGAAHHQKLMLVMGAVSVLMSVAQTSYLLRRKAHTANGE
jgi:hypothetical protein